MLFPSRARRLQRRRRFWTRSDLPRWLARFVGGGDVVIREDARWPDSGGQGGAARLELYTENDSHTHLISVREWCTYEEAPAEADCAACESSTPPRRTVKRLHVCARVSLHPWWLMSLERRLESFLVRRWLDSLTLGAAVDDAICAQILAERQLGERDVAQQRHLSPATPQQSAPPPCATAAARPFPALPLVLQRSACVGVKKRDARAELPPRRRKKRIVPALLMLAKVGAAALCARALPVAFALRR
jgi:hypothetical protein